MKVKSILVATKDNYSLPITSIKMVVSYIFIIGSIITPSNF